MSIAVSTGIAARMFEAGGSVQSMTGTTVGRAGGRGDGRSGVEEGRSGAFVRSDRSVSAWSSVPVVRLGPGGDFTRDFGGGERANGRGTREGISRASEAEWSAGHEQSGERGRSGQDGFERRFEDLQEGRGTEDGEHALNGQPGEYEGSLDERLRVIAHAEAVLAEQGSVIEGLAGLVGRLLSVVERGMRALGNAWGTPDCETLRFDWAQPSARGVGRSKGRSTGRSVGRETAGASRAWSGAGARQKEHSPLAKGGAGQGSEKAHGQHAPGSDGARAERNVGHEPHTEAAQDSSAHPGLARASGVFAHDAGAGRRAGRQQGDGVRARRGAHQEERPGARAEQGTLFVDC